MIRLDDLLKIEDYGKVKVRFNLNNGEDDPLVLVASNPKLVNTQWTLWNSKKKNLGLGLTVVSLVRIREDLWLLTTIKEITKDLNVLNGIGYEAKELKEYESLFARVIVKYHKKSQQPVRWAEPIIDELEVVQILPSIFDGNDFPGYDSVRLSFRELETIINRHKKDWVSALENQKAIYLIKDKNNGKCYVGSATGNNGMLLQRWSNYVHDGHGGNLELKNIVNSLGFNYVKENFEYSILENYNSRVDQKYIIKRETWWKETLGTKEFGYNKN